MSKEPPFDVWDGEELGLDDESPEVAAEEEAMHVDPDSEVAVAAGPHWSELTDEEPGEEPTPVSYFADEQPEAADAGRSSGRGDQNVDGDAHEPDLEELLERQHYAFPDR